MKLNERQQAALDLVEDTAWKRHLLEREVDKQLALIRNRVYAEFDQEMAKVVTTAKNLGVPNRRIGLAWGTTNNKTAREIVEKYWKSDRV